MCVSHIICSCEHACLKSTDGAMRELYVNSDSF